MKKLQGRVLVVTKKEGLNKNLIRLAMGTWKGEMLFAEPQEVDSNKWSRTKWALIDDRAFPSPEKMEDWSLQQERGPILIFLLENPADDKLQKKFPNGKFLAKPFAPEDLAEVFKAK